MTDTTPSEAPAATQPAVPTSDTERRPSSSHYWTHAWSRIM